MKWWLAAAAAAAAVLLRRQAATSYEADDAHETHEPHSTPFDPNKTTLLVIAHPDDEALFFAPTVIELRRKLHLLCLSTGDADGRGATRRAELHDAAAALGLPSGRVTALDALRDGHDERWPPERIARLVARRAWRLGATQLITFDEEGVSGHPNHVALHRGVGLLTSRKGSSVRAAYKLRSPGLSTRFIGPLALLPAIASCALARALGRPCWDAATSSPLACHRAMAAHGSQYVWWRRLHVIFASVSYVNILVPM